MDCRAACGACCIAPSISSPIPGMPHGKPAGIPCVQLRDDLGCAIFGSPERPAVCRSLKPVVSMCGSTRDGALDFLSALEVATLPGSVRVLERIAEQPVPVQHRQHGADVLRIDR